LGLFLTEILIKSHWLPEKLAETFSEAMSIADNRKYSITIRPLEDTDDFTPASFFEQEKKVLLRPLGQGWMSFKDDMLGDPSKLLAALSVKLQDIVLYVEVNDSEYII
jgi:hypothetical protein